MKALVYHGPGNKSWEEKPLPGITHPGDAIVKIYKTTIRLRQMQLLQKKHVFPLPPTWWIGYFFYTAIAKNSSVKEIESYAINYAPLQTF